MKWIDKKEYYENIARDVTPASTLMVKEGVFWTIVAYIQSAATLGIKKPHAILSDSAAALGPIQAFPRSFGILYPEEIVHEARHTLQMEICGWVIPVLGWFFGRKVRAWCGLPLFLILNLLPLPILVNYGRFRLELDAESTAWRVGLKDGWLTPKEIKARAALFGRSMFMLDYFFAWPWAKGTAARKADKIINEGI